MTAEPKRPKRPNGDGSIPRKVVRNGKESWVAQIMLGYRPDGTRDRRSVRAATQKECLARIRALRAQAETGVLTSSRDGRQTIAQFLTIWLASIDGTIEPQSLRRHRNNVEHHLVPLLGSKPLARLRPEHVVELLSRLRQKQILCRAHNAKRPVADDEPTRPLAPRTIRYCYTTLRLALDTAVAWKLLASNVVRDVKPPRVPKAEILALGPDEVVQLVDAAYAADDQLAPLWEIAAETGLREGELLGLTWDDIRLDQGTLTVNRTLVGARGGCPLYSDPKTERSARTLAISTRAVDALRKIADRQLFLRQALGDRWHPHDHRLVFSTGVGTPYNPSNVWTYFRRAAARVGLDRRYSLHKLRHGAATTMLASGVHLKVASERLGHHSPAFTAARYGHVIAGLDRQAAEAITGALDAARSRARRKA